MYSENLTIVIKKYSTEVSQSHIYVCKYATCKVKISGLNYKKNFIIKQPFISSSHGRTRVFGNFRSRDLACDMVSHCREDYLT